MWDTPLVPDCTIGANAGYSTYGLGWSIGSRNGRRIAAHGGFGHGFTPQPDVYSDDRLVIAPTTNTRDLTVDTGSDWLDGDVNGISLTGLSSALAEIVLNP